MASTSAYSKRSSSVKRLLQEAKELASETGDGIHAAPFEDNLYHWHFTITGPKDSEFEGGLYHGRITLPPQYPFKAPDIMLLTPNGRFELNKKVCLTITGFHEESWQPAWGIRTALVGLSSFFTTEAKGAIGGLDAPASERKRLAALSRDWTCPGCKKKNSEILPPASEKDVEQDVPEAKTAVSTKDSADTEPTAGASSSAPNDTTQLSGTKATAEQPSKPVEAIPGPPLVSSTANAASSSAPSEVPSNFAFGPAPPRRRLSPTRSTRSDSMSRQQVEERHLEVVELLSRHLALNDPSTAMNPATSASQSVAFAAPASASQGRSNAGNAVERASAPPMWLDGAIGAVLIALASLIFRKVM